MADLRTRFASLDQAVVPDLWPEIERRALEGAPSAGPSRVADVSPTWRGAEPDFGAAGSRRLVLVLVLIGLLVVTLLGAALVGSGLVRMPSFTTPSESVPPEAGFALQPIQIEDFSAVASIPDTWQVVPVECCPDYREYIGTAPEGHLSVSHESPYSVTLCSPDCDVVEVPMSIPYSAVNQYAALKAGVAAIAGGSDWSELAPGLLPEVEGAARLDSIAVASDGREWRRAHIIGLRDRNLVAITFAQPTDVYDDRLLDAILGGISLPSAPVYSDGDLLDGQTGHAGFTMPLPGMWLGEEQPALDDKPLSGLRRYSDRVMVSLGDVEGTLGWCDPECGKLTGLTSLDALEAAIRAGRSLGPAEETTLGGEVARVLRTDDPVERRYVIAMHDGRPVALMMDVGDWDVAPGVLDEMIARFAFVKPEPKPATQTLPVARGRAEIDLSDAWAQSPTTDGLLTMGVQELTVEIGDKKGRIVTCVRPAGPWEQCRIVTAKTLDDLVASVQPLPVEDGGIPLSPPKTDATTLGGEPGAVVRIQAYEPEAQGGQEVVYIVAMHHGRPVIVRIWTSENEAADLDSVIAGFRFTD